MPEAVEGDLRFRVHDESVMQVWDQIRADCEGDEYRGASHPRDVFENLVCEIECEYHEIIKDLRAALSRAEAEREEVVKALEPFAKVGETFVKSSDDPLLPWGTADTTRVDLFRASAVTRDVITAGDMRRAAEVSSRLSRASHMEEPK